jgi:hypothetical protein
MLRVCVNVSNLKKKSLLTANLKIHNLPTTLSLNSQLPATECRLNFTSDCEAVAILERRCNDLRKKRDNDMKI